MGPAPITQRYDADAAADEAARLKSVREFVATCKAARRSNSEAMHEDNLMLKGGEDQWDPQAVRERRGKRPIYTGNRFPAMLSQITGEIRRNKPGIMCKPGDAAATPENAAIFEGIIRAIERLSQAPLAYARAGKSAAACGEGHLRIIPVREDDEGFDTGLRIRAIKNVHSVLWDQGAQAPDKSDANRCVVFSEVDRKGFEEAYPKAGASAWEKASAGFRQMDGWRSDASKITVAEEWVVKREPYERYRIAKTQPAMMTDPESGMPIWTDATGEEATIDGDVRKHNVEALTIDGVPEEQYLAALTAHGFEIIDRRTAYKKQICMYLWAGDRQVAGPIEWKGSRIPIFTVVGEEIDVGEETVTHGIIRHAKDAQRLHNYARSADLELVAQAPKAPIMVSNKQIEGWEDVWVLAARQPVPYLPYNETPAGAPRERNGPGTNPGPSSLAQSGIQDMQDVVGIHDASLGKRSNETSGVAIEARDAQSDTGTYVYLDNLNATIEAIGAELVAAIPHYYSSREQILILGADDAPAIIEMANVKLDQGKYHVIAQRGPSYQSKREKAADLIAQTMNVAPPPAIPILFKTLFELSDVPNGERISEEMTAAFVMAGLMPPPPQQGAPPGMPGPPGAPPMPGQPPPSNVIPMPPQRRGPPMGADPLAGIAPPPLPPPNAPAVRTRAGP